MLQLVVLGMRHTFHFPNFSLTNSEEHYTSTTLAIQIHEHILKAIDFNNFSKEHTTITLILI